MPPFLAGLLAQGLSLVGNAALVKGSEWIKEKTGVDVTQPKLTPDEVFALRRFEHESQVELLKIQQEDDRITLELQKMVLEDTQNARSMQIAALAQADAFSKHFIYIFAMLWCFTAAVYIFCITFLTIPKESVRFADTILGFILGTVIAQIINYFYGYSNAQISSTRLENKNVSRT